MISCTFALRCFAGWGRDGGQSRRNRTGFFEAYTVVTGKQHKKQTHTHTWCRYFCPSCAARWHETKHRDVPRTRREAASPPVWVVEFAVRVRSHRQLCRRSHIQTDSSRNTFRRKEQRSTVPLLATTPTNPVFSPQQVTSWTSACRPLCTYTRNRIWHTRWRVLGTSGIDP